jgi:hypothetical protein
MFIGATKIAIAEQAYQPSKELTVAFLLSPEELPGTGWKCSGQQDMPSHSFHNGEPELIRAKLAKSTTSRRQFKTSSNSRTVIDEVAPFANTDDAESWVASADQRVKNRVSNIVDLEDFHLIDHLELPGAGHARGFEYATVRAAGRRMRTVVAANVGNIFTIVTCLEDDEFWPIEEVLYVVQAQIEKIKAVQKVNDS